VLYNTVEHVHEGELGHFWYRDGSPLRFISRFSFHRIGVSEVKV